MDFLSFLKALFARLFSRDPDELRRKAELKKVYAVLADRRPAYYKPKPNIVLPAFAVSVRQFYALLSPLAELARATIANTDVRVGQLFFDYLIDSRLPAPSRESKRFFCHEGMAERLAQALNPEEELEAIHREFQTFLQSLDELGHKAVNIDLYETERFVDICRHDYERILALFDPSISLEDPNYEAEFTPAPGEHALPEIMDLYYLFEGFAFSSQIKDTLLVLLDRRQPGSVDGKKSTQINKLFSKMDMTLAERLNPETLLALIRAIKGEPSYVPETLREKKDYLESYERRLKAQFEKDRERILRERHADAISADIQALFGDTEVLEIEGYDDDNDAYLRHESPYGFMYIKPLRVLKTFIAQMFEQQFSALMKRFLVEGFFDNKAFQNNLANVLYQCERSGGRISEFEAQLKSSGRVSIVAMKRYIEEMRRGRDISTFLEKLVDTINGRAREIVEDEAGLFTMLLDALVELAADYRRPSPETVSNIRTLGGARNREIMAQLLSAKDKLALLSKIMRNFTNAKTASPAETAATQALPAPVASGL